MRKRPAMAALALLAALLVHASGALAASNKYEGKALSCKYTLEAGGHQYSAKIDECGGKVDPEAEIERSWLSEEGVSSTTITLSSAKVSLAGQEESISSTNRLLHPSTSTNC